MYSNRQSGAARYQTIVNSSDIDSAANGVSCTWQQAEQTEQCGDLLQAAARYLACPPLPGRGTAPAHFHAAWCYERGERLEEAVHHYAAAVEQSDEPGLVVEALYRLAWIALTGGDSPRAAPLFKRAVATADASGLHSATAEHARYWYTTCIEADGQSLAAADHYSLIVTAGRPDLWPEAAYRRLLCLSLIGDFDGALQAAEALLQPAAPAADETRLKALQALAREEQAQILRARETA